MTKQEIIIGLIEDTISVDTMDQIRINNIINESYQTHVNYNGEISAEDWADEYGADDQEEMILEDIAEAWDVD